MSNETFRSGFVAIIGRANAGKSTLVNKLVGEKVAIVSPKPQTTRNTIRGIVNDDDCQIVLVDTPGLHRPRTKLGKFMDQQTKTSVHGMDVVVLMIDAARAMNKADEVAIGILEDIDSPVVAILNKTDLIEKESLLTIIESLSKNKFISEIIPISALYGDGTDLVLEAIKKHLNEGPKYFDDEAYTDQPEMKIASEMIRESILYLLHDEIPHGVGVDVRSMQYKKSGTCEIHADILCSKNSHKGMIIGKQGTMLKHIGSRARQQVEKMVGTKVNLKLWVRVKENWQNNAGVMKELGYHNE